MAVINAKAADTTYKATLAEKGRLDTLQKEVGTSVTEGEAHHTLEKKTYATLY